MPENSRLLDFLLTRAARRLPDKRFLDDGQRQVTYAQADDAANRFAASLHAHGVRRHDRVAVFANNRVEVPLAAMGALRADGAFLVVNPSTKADKLHYVLQDSGARALVVETATAEEAQRALALGGLDLGPVYCFGPEPPPDGMLSWDAALASAGPPPRREAIDRDLAALVYTSGSTGRPKGVMLPHATLRHTTWSISTYLENREDDVLLSALPLAFDYGFYQVTTAMRVGATLLLEPRFALPFPILERMQRERVTGFPGVPTMFALILRMRELGGMDFSHLRYFSNTADALPPEHIARLREIFPQTTIYSMYGLTECTRVCYLDPAELDRRPRSVGRAIPNTEVWLEREDGSRGGPGDTGILVVRGSHVMAGYWRNEEATNKVLEPGPLPGERVLRSGDLFRMDEEGFLYYLGRSDNIIKTRGEKVAPREVEDVLHQHPAVLQAAVTGEPDPVLGQRILAFAVLRPEATATPAELLEHCRGRLEDYMVPKRVAIVEELPTTDTGKVSRRLLGGGD